MASRSLSALTASLTLLLSLGTPVEAAPSELHHTRAAAVVKPVAGYVYQGW
jgi:hypothetical protein